MSDKDSTSLSVSISRGLTDKLVERRKEAALELERSPQVASSTIIVACTNEFRL